MRHVPIFLFERLHVDVRSHFFVTGQQVASLLIGIVTFSQPVSAFGVAQPAIVVATQGAKVNLDNQSGGRRFGKTVVSRWSLTEFHRAGLAVLFRKSIPCLQRVLHAGLKVRPQNLAVGGNANSVATGTGELQTANISQEVSVR
jgi:hypothetical protein